MLLQNYCIPIVLVLAILCSIQTTIIVAASVASVVLYRMGSRARTMRLQRNVPGEDVNSMPKKEGKQ